MVKWCFYPDIHAVGSMRDGHPILSRDWIKAVASSAELASKADVIILPGDVFDFTKVDGDAVEYMRLLVDGIKSAGKRVYFIEGNHDAQPKGVSPLAKAIGCEMLTEQGTMIDGKRVVGINYCAREQLLPKLASVSELPAVDLLVLHVAMQEFLGFDGAWQISAEDIPDNVKNVLVGDIHIKKCINLPSGGWMLSPGVLHAKSVDQDYTKCVWTWDGVNKPTEMPIWTRPIHHFKVSKENIDEFFTEVSKIEVTPEKIVLDVVCTPDITGILRQEARTGRLQPFIFIERKETKDEDVQDEEQSTDLRITTEERLTLEAALPFEVDRTKDSEMYDFLFALLTSDSKKVIEEVAAT